MRFDTITVVKEPVWFLATNLVAQKGKIPDAKVKYARTSVRFQMMPNTSEVRLRVTINVKMSPVPTLNSLARKMINPEYFSRTSPLTI